MSRRTQFLKNLSDAISRKNNDKCGKSKIGDSSRRNNSAPHITTSKTKGRGTNGKFKEDEVVTGDGIGSPCPPFSDEDHHDYRKWSERLHLQNGGRSESERPTIHQHSTPKTGQGTITHPIHDASRNLMVQTVEASIPPEVSSSDSGNGSSLDSSLGKHSVEASGSGNKEVAVDDHKDVANNPSGFIPSSSGPICLVNEKLSSVDAKSDANNNSSNETLALKIQDNVLSPDSEDERSFILTPDKVSDEQLSKSQTSFDVETSTKIKPSSAFKVKKRLFSVHSKVDATNNSMTETHDPKKKSGISSPDSDYVSSLISTPEKISDEHLTGSEMNVAEMNHQTDKASHSTVIEASTKVTTKSGLLTKDVSSLNSSGQNSVLILASVPDDSDIVLDPQPSDINNDFDFLFYDEVVDIEEVVQQSEQEEEEVQQSEQEEEEVQQSEQEEGFPPIDDQPRTPKGTRHYTPPEKLTRKKQRHPEKWKKAVIKQKIARGEEYINSKGKLIRARSVQPPCDASCRMKCSTKITEADRKGIHDSFYKKHKTREEKWGFISRHVTQFEKKTNTESATRRKFTRKYSFKVGVKDIPVCKTMFLATLDINDGMVDTVCLRLTKGGVLSPDKRGKHETFRKKLDPAINSSVKEHINALPRMPSHYSRSTTNKEFLSAEIQSQKAMHELYVEWMSENHPEKKVASYRQYSDIFNSEFNISFFVWKKDRCDDCVQYENSTGGEQEEMREKYEEHVRNKDLALAMYSADRIVSQQKTSQNLVVGAFDYEKTLVCPKSNASVFYYRRKLTISNFTIVDEGRHDNYCYVYDESIGTKGPNEVGSFLVHFIGEKANNGITEFRLYSDNCFPQNKNRGVTAALLHAAAKYNVIIRHRFLEKGHTYNAADTVHSLVERKSKPLNIYSPEEWFKVIGEAKRSIKNPIKVVRIDQTMIFDWKALAEKLNLTKDIDGNALPWQKVRELSYDGSNPYQLKFKINLDDRDSTTVNVRNVGKPVNLKNFVASRAYEKPRPISQKKFKDLIFYCDQNFIPPEHQDIYRKLEQADNSESEEDEATPKPGRAKKMRPKGKKGRGKKRPANSPDVIETENLDSDPDDVIALPPSPKKRSKKRQ